MIVEVGGKKYRWIERWAEIVDNDSGRTNGRTHGVQITSSGEVVVFCQANPSILIFNAAGTLLRSWGAYLGAHGMTRTTEDGIDHLWLTDEKTQEVVKTTLDGTVTQSIDKPPHPAYAAGGKYIPTWAAVSEARFGGNGDIWTADGYGSSLVHRYNKYGEYLSSLDGTTGAGRFNCPHGVAIDNRSGQAQLLVADRGNHRVQVFDLEGDFIRSFGSDFLVAPDCFSTYKELLLVPELLGRVALLDGENRLIGYLGRNDLAQQAAGWPNLSREQFEPGKFSSPHGGTFDNEGNIYVVEWIIGGRITKLAVET